MKQDKKRLLIIQFEGVLGVFFFKYKLEDKGFKYNLKKDTFGVINNLISLIINLSQHYSIFIIIKNKTLKNKFFINNIYHKIINFITGILEIVEINKNCLYLNTKIINKIILDKKIYLNFIFSLNCDFSIINNFDNNNNHVFKNLKILSHISNSKVIYIKNILFLENKNFKQINDNFIKINNGYYSKILNILIKKSNKNWIQINYNNIKEYNSLYNQYKLVYGLKYFRKEAKYNKVSLNSDLWKFKLKFFGSISSQDNKINDFYNRNLHILKKYLLNVKNWKQRKNIEIEQINVEFPKNSYLLA